MKLLFVVAMILSRFIILLGDGWANFSPLIAMSLFIGYYFTATEAVLLTFVSVVLSNLIINNTIYSEYFPQFSHGVNVYVLIFLVITLIGQTRKNILLTNLVSVFLFYLVSNLFVFLSGMYEYSWTGLLQCYIFALPFLKTSIIAQVFFGTLMFGGYELTARKYYGL